MVERSAPRMKCAMVIFSRHGLQRARFDRWLGKVRLRRERCLGCSSPRLRRFQCADHNAPVHLVRRSPLVSSVKARPAPSRLLSSVATKKSPPKTDGAEADLTYEQMVEKIEEITARIESGDVGLEQSIALYEQGVHLGKRCQEILRNAQQKVEELNQQLSKAGGIGGALGSNGDLADSQEDE